jgi:hypothetical protein
MAHAKGYTGPSVGKQKTGLAGEECIGKRDNPLPNNGEVPGTAAEA